MKRRRKTYRRGRTRPERAALLDALLGDILELPPSAPCRFVDVGYGDEPTTTERTHRALIDLGFEAQSVGVEIEKARVERAQALTNEDIRFVLGSFDLPSLGINSVSFVRCLNVLRGYGLWDVKGALLQMGRALRPGGILMEGTSDVGGALAAVHVWRRKSSACLDYEGLVCVTDFSRGFSPLMFRDVLPRDLRRHAKDGEPVFEWLKAWDDEARAIRQALRNDQTPRVAPDRNRNVFSESVSKLASVDGQTDARWAPRGVVVWKPERPGTRPEVLSPDDPL